MIGVRCPGAERNCLPDQSGSPLQIARCKSHQSERVIRRIMLGKGFHRLHQDSLSLCPTGNIAENDVLFERAHWQLVPAFGKRADDEILRSGRVVAHQLGNRAAKQLVPT